jgi:histidinol-phosphate aminotransferase
MEMVMKTDCGIQEGPKLLPCFQSLVSYPTEEGRGAFIRMDFNEGPTPPLEFLSQALSRCALAATMYPEYGGLKRAAAEAWNVTPEMVMPVNGADEGISLLIRGFTGPGDAVVLPVPAFPMYRIYADLCGTPVIPVPLTQDFALDLEATAKAVPKGAVLSLSSPNNPTGRAISEADLLALLEVAAGKPVLMDETYAPYACQDFAPLLASYPNLIILRTLSKAYGMPGLRCGFILADPRVISRMDVLRSPLNVNAVSATLGARLLTGDPEFRDRIRLAVEARISLQARMESAGIPTVPSDAHFFMAKLGGKATSAAAMLRTKGILVKDLANTVPGMLRISVATPQDAARLAENLLPWWAERTKEGGRP